MYTDEEIGIYATSIAFLQMVVKRLPSIAATEGMFGIMAKNRAKEEE